MEQQPQQTHAQPHQQDGQQPPQRRAPQGSSHRVIGGLLLHGPGGSGGEGVTRPLGSPTVRSRASASSREDADGVRVPHKQVLALVRLQHELRDAHAGRGPAVEHDGGRHVLGILAAAGGVGGHHHVQRRSWGGGGGGIKTHGGSGAEQSRLKQPTFDVVFGFGGGADPAVVLSVQLDLADVGAHTAGQRVVGDARQLDVVHVAVAVGADVSGRLVGAEGSDRWGE